MEVQRQITHGKVPVDRQDVEGVELHLLVMPARVQGVEAGDAVTPSTTASPSMTELAEAFFSTASTIHGKRLVQSVPPRVMSRAKVAPSQDCGLKSDPGAKSKSLSPEAEMKPAATSGRNRTALTLLLA
jgi:hypothetical protein